MVETTLVGCVKHVWERHLEVHNHLQRVVRVCAQCGCKEICWSQFPGRRKFRNRRSGLAVPDQSAPVAYGPERNL
jgi:hypothetical protein